MFIFGPLLKLKTTKPNATLLMLLFKTISEGYGNSYPDSKMQRCKEFMNLITKSIPMTLISIYTYPYVIQRLVTLIRYSAFS